MRNLGAIRHIIVRHGLRDSGSRACHRGRHSRRLCPGRLRVGVEHPQPLRTSADRVADRRAPPSTAGTSRPPPGQGGGGAQPGTLTSGAWDDNLNFDFYRRYLDSMAAVEGQNRAWPFVARADRLEVLVTNELGAPLGDAPSPSRGRRARSIQSATRSDGRVFVFPSWFGIPAGTPLVVSATHDGAGRLGGGAGR